MKPLRVLLLFALCLQIGCGSDGGPVGTGIASGISGNVVAVESSTGGASTSGVRVTVGGENGVEATTDEDGNFEVTGDFAGPVAVRFTTPEYSSEEVVDVPDGATVVMRDVTLREGEIELPPPTVLGFYGQITLVDCSGDTQTILVNDRRAMPNQILVRINANTDIARGSGEPLTCRQLSVGNAVAIQGALLLRERTMLAITITVGPPPPGTAPPVRDLRFRGPILVINCPQGQLLLNDEQRTRLRLEPGVTQIRNAQNQLLRCVDLHPGDTIAGVGEITTRRPGVIIAREILRQATASQ